MALRIRMLLATLAVSLLITSPAPAQLDALKKLAMGGGKGEVVKKVAYFKIKGALSETPVEMPPLFGSEPPMSLKGLLARFKQARLDNEVVGIVLDLQQAAPGVAQLQEIHAALRKFAAVDKDIFIHADTLTTMTYAAATASSHISLVPTGDLWLTGLYGEQPYIKGTLDKIDCRADFLYCGDFKSAHEMFTRTGPSEDAQANVDWLLDGIYEDIVALIAEGRGISEDKVRALIDGGPYSAEDALKAGLIDSVQHRQDFIADLKHRYGEHAEFVTDYGKTDLFEIPQDNFFAMFEFMMQLLNPKAKQYTEPSVAIVYVEGAIQTGAAEPSPFGGSEGAYSTSIRKALDKAAKDDTVKAVVLRVDSPGGSALASEIILDATRRVVKNKPLIVSMGNVAASGGYYVSCAAETIFADSSTITASIGVVGGKIVTTGMWDKLGINWHANQRGAMAGLFSTARPFNDGERAKLRHYMDSVYDIFKGHVVASRGDKLTKPIDKLAAGRVFTGKQALELGLVDRLGGLEDAIKFAGKKAGISDYDIRVIPEPPTIFDLLGGESGDNEFTSAAVFARGPIMGQPFIQAMLPAMATLDPLRTKAIIHALKGIELIHQDGIMMMMPGELVIQSR